MRIIEAKIYKCDHCGKVQFRKCDMTKHEKWCKENPNNKHYCFGYCVHLLKTKEEYEGQDRYESGGTFVGQRTVFTCAVTNQRMYSFLAEKRKIPIPEGAVRMPLQCDLYKDRGEFSLPEDWLD